MFKRKKQIKILPAAEYWNKKLDMDYPTEFARYKYLCGYPAPKKLKSLKTETFITYHDWKAYIEQKLEKLTTEELTEYYYFLNSKVRAGSMTKSITTNFILPFTLSFYIPHVITELLNYTEKTSTFIDFEAYPGYRLAILLIYIVILTIIISLHILRDLRDDELTRHYYEDLKYIVKTKLDSPISH